MWLHSPAFCCCCCCILPNKSPHHFWTAVTTTAAHGANVRHTTPPCVRGGCVLLLAPLMLKTWGHKAARSLNGGPRTHAMKGLGELSRGWVWWPLLCLCVVCCMNVLGCILRSDGSVLTVDETSKDNVDAPSLQMTDSFLHRPLCRFHWVFLFFFKYNGKLFPGVCFLFSDDGLLWVCAVDESGGFCRLHTQKYHVCTQRENIPAGPTISSGHSCSPHPHCNGIVLGLRRPIRPPTLLSLASLTALPLSCPSTAHILRNNNRPWLGLTVTKIWLVFLFYLRLESSFNVS